MAFLTSLLFLLALPLSLVSIFIAMFLPNNRLWIAILCGFAGGLLLGFSQSNFLDGLIFGVISGVFFNVAVIPCCLLNKFCRTKGLAYLRDLRRSRAYNPRATTPSGLHIRVSRSAMIDLTNKFLEANRGSGEWSHEKTEKVIDMVRTLETNLVIQDNLDDETATWARLDASNAHPAAPNSSGLAGMIRYDMPLAILHRSTSTKAKQILQDAGFQILVVPDLDEQVYCLQVEKIAKIFPNNTWDFDVVDPSRFSIADLLFLTAKS